MKKVMMMMAGMLLAGAVNAASVNWATGTLTTVLTGYTTTWQGQTAYFYLCNESFDLSGIIAGLKDGGTIPGSVGSPDLSVALSTKGATTGTGASTEFGAGQYAYGWGVAFNADRTQFAILAVTKSNVFPTGANATLTFGGLATVYDIAPVPEPTAMALIALGVAAVGLRRKFTK
ncbi:MAG: PEP-CTERM sorting domain-containing protein [Oscillospiraceae bacterium]|jgi:hypothetical protein|nr:PEP-CTERM sorting domain-containing protein [Oscillospiraceae bacterium]